ncbi:MAG: hypothetical protein WCL32_23490 [Planctomycetota bacterium]
MTEAILGVRHFTDGSVRTVYLDVEGRQYVCDENERRVYGVWLDPEKAEPDQCVVISSGDTPTSPTTGKVGNLHEECRREVQSFHWIESEKAGMDLGQDAIRRWVREHWSGFLRAKIMEHLLGQRFWIELDRGDFGMLNAAFPEDRAVVEWVVEQLNANQDNLGIITAAMDVGRPVEKIVQILEALDINSRRLLAGFGS